MKANPQTSRDDVLYAFAVESEPDLKQWLQDYPQYAAELIDLSHELSRDEYENTMPFSEQDQALIDREWKKHIE